MMIDRPYSASAQVRIAELTEEADTATHAACVVDYLGYYDDEGPVTSDCEPRRRFGVRSLQHVRIYGFTVVYYGMRCAQ